MAKISIPYGKTAQEAEISDERLQAVLTSKLEEYSVDKPEEELVREALDNPIESKKLEELSVGKDKVVILCSDHTRPVPSKIIIPQMLERIRKGNPDADITLLVCTGCHRPTTDEELRNKFGDDIVDNEKIYIHDSNDESMLAYCGKLPSGGDIYVNKLTVEADLLVSEGFIEPHFFAGYSGGRKSVFPGCCSKKTVMYNHNSEFIASPNARTGILKGNPIHQDMVSAARQLNLVFICNVIINSDKKIIHAVAGDLEAAHEAGTSWLDGFAAVPKTESDIAITGNGGYPLDQNIYQSVKSMTAAEANVREGGVIIECSACNDGTGGDSFYKTFKEEKDVDKITKKFMETPREDTIEDQWESQILARILTKATVIYVSDVDDQILEDMHFVPAKDLEEALEKAEEIVGKDSTVTAIPDGIAVIAK